MRPIKFRAWHKKDRRWLPIFENVRYFLNMENGSAVWDEKWSEYLECDVQQFTGLTDKNGKEIYEGDVIRFFFNADHGYGDKDSGYTEMIDTVEFTDGCFYFVNRDIGGGAFAFRHNEFCEVIGNIYENPELLGK